MPSARIFFFSFVLFHFVHVLAFSTNELLFSFSCNLNKQKGVFQSHFHSCFISLFMSFDTLTIECVWICFAAIFLIYKNFFLDFFHHLNDINKMNEFKTIAAAATATATKTTNIAYLRVMANLCRLTHIRLTVSEE